MTDYTKTTNFTAKDSLSTGDPLKLIKGSYFDTEFDNIVTAIATKYDSSDIASQVQAEALSSNTVLLTPGRLKNVMDDNAAALTDIQALTDPAADRILFWDDSDNAIEWLVPGDGIEINGNNLQLPSSLAGAGLTIASGVLAVGGGNGITANADTVDLTDQAATSTCPVSLSSGTLGFDITAVTDFGTTAGADLNADTLLINDGGTLKEILASQLATPEVVTIADATDTLDEGDFGKTILYSNAAPAITLPNSLKAGYWVTLVYTGTPGAGLSLSAAGTLNTANSLTGTATQYSAITVYHAGSNVWYAWGGLDT